MIRRSTAIKVVTHLATLFFLNACSQGINFPVPDFIKKSGDTMNGTLTLPKDGLQVGDNQLILSGGKLGVGTANPTATLSVAGWIHSSTGGVMFPDGSTQSTAAGGSCFGGICAGDTTFSGAATFSGLPTGAAATSAGLSINPATAGANTAILGASVGGAQKFAVDAEGDAFIAGQLNVSGGFSCATCINTGDLVNASVDGTKIANAAVSLAHLAANSVDATKIVAGSLSIATFTAGANNSVLTTDNTGAVQWLPPQVQYGLQFVYSTTSRILLQPAGINGSASILVASGTDLRSVVINAALTLDLTVSGAGGIDTGAEAANTGYDVRLITQNAGAAPALLATVSGNAPTLPAAYTYASEILWFVSNTQGGALSDIANFADIGMGRCLYRVNMGVRVLNGGAATTVTAVSLASAAPSNTGKVKIYVRSLNNSGVTSIDLNLYSDAAGTNAFFTVQDLLNLLLLNSRSRHEFSVEVGLSSGTTNSLFYAFSANSGTQAVSIYTQEWYLPRRMGL